MTQHLLRQIFTLCLCSFLGKPFSGIVLEHYRNPPSIPEKMKDKLCSIYVEQQIFIFWPFYLQMYIGCSTFLAGLYDSASLSRRQNTAVARLHAYFHTHLLIPLNRRRTCINIIIIFWHSIEPWFNNNNLVNTPVFPLADTVYACMESFDVIY